MSIFLNLLFGVCCAALVYVLVMTVSALLVDPSGTDLRESPYYRFLLNFSTAWVLKCARVKIHAEGLEKVPETGRFLLVSNHRSKFDPIITWYVFRRRQLAFISKPENFKVPWFGRIIRKCCFLPIDRGSLAAARGTFRRAAELIRNDQVSMAVYPEGTRSRTKALLPFHAAVFSVAGLAHVPVVVMSIRGTEEICRHFPLRHTDITFRILETIPSDWVDGHTIIEISERARADMENGGLSNE